MKWLSSENSLVALDLALIPSISDTVLMELYSFKLVLAGSMGSGATVLYSYGSLFTT